MAVSLLSALRASRSLLGRRARLRVQTPKPHGHTRGFSTRLFEDNEGLVLKSSVPGEFAEKRLSKMWLRDISPKRIRQHENGVDVTWSDSHESTYTWTWLRAAIHGVENKELRGLHAIRLWNSSIVKDPPKVSYASVMDKDDITGMADLTSKIVSSKRRSERQISKLIQLQRRQGFCFVTDSPITPEATEKLLKAIGPIRNTHYGGFYDFLPDLAKADTAYTNMALAAHTDTTYFTEPAGLQAFHMLSHTPPLDKPDLDETSLGGKSLLVDGFYVAHRMRREFPSAYEVLRTIRVPWHASGNQDVAMSPDRAYPVLDASPKRLNRVRWNNDDRGAVPLHVENIDEWYDAARKWDNILRRPHNSYWFQLRPGQILINRDDFISRWQLSNFPREEVIMTNMLRK
ncbi:hypothetical protein E4U21_002684 [Claviceps maximensis]|nr:hypothetical protein E4U21_002684 [Claviceps maximensis]